jgi:hypothetical protein
VFCFLAVALRAAPPSPAADEAAWAITDMNGIIEGLAIHPATGETYFSDVFNRCIWYRDVSGPSAVMKKFSTDDDGLLGVFALKFSADGRSLWASSSALPEMKGYTDADQGRALLAEYDLSTRRLRRTHALPADGRPHVLGDMTLAADGTLYVTDSLSPLIWRLAPGGDQLEKWVENPEFRSLQGVAFSGDGRSLYVADYPRGLRRIDLESRQATLLPAPTGTELRGVDGLYPVAGGLVAIQNGTKTQRIIRIVLDDTGAVARVTELMSGHPAMTDLSLGQVVNNRLQFIADSGWALYEKPTATPGPRPVTILSTRID